MILASGALIGSLQCRDLIYPLTIHPLALGSGQKLFEEGTAAQLRLVDAKPTTTDVMIARYAR